MVKKRKSIPDSLKACGVLVVRGSPIDSFLLMVHDDRLDLPKGHVEPGETELECALRELREETAVQPEQIEIDDNFRFETEYEVRPSRYDDQPIPKTVVIFLGRLLHDVEIQVTEHIGYEWRPWRPPHSIQPETIDHLLAAVADYLDDLA